MHTLQVVCAWCSASMGTKPCAPAQAGKVSHGCCDTCAAEIRACIDAMPDSAFALVEV